MQYMIGVDVGTSGCKAAIFDEEYELRAFAHREYPVDAPRPGWAECRPEQIWDALCGTVRESLAQLTTNVSEDGFGLCFSVFGDALIVSDESGKALCPGILSTDTRSAAIAERIAGDVGAEAVYAITGRFPHNSAPAPRMIWVKENLAALDGPGIRFLDVLSWLHLRMGLGAVSDYSNAAGSMLYDINRKRWCPQLLDYAGIAETSLYRAVQAGTRIGRPSKDGARALGFPNAERVEVIAGAMDQMCNATGAGVVEPGNLVCSIGTVEAVTVVLDPLVSSTVLMELNMPRGMGALADQFITLVLLWDAGRSLRWLCDQFGASERERALREGISVYDVVLSGVPGDRDVFYLPHLSGGGTPWQDPASRGAFLGLTTASDLPSLARAVIAGVTYELKTNIDCLESAGMRVDDLKVVGGGARSDVWLQLKADVLERDVYRLAMSEAGCLGAALLAGYGCGWFDDLPAASRRYARTAEVFHPTGRSLVEQQRYAVYRQIYPALKPLNARIAQLDGV